MTDDSFRDSPEARRARSRARRRGGRPAKKRPDPPTIARIDPNRTDEADAGRDYDNPFAPPAQARPRKRRKGEHHVDASLGQRFTNMVIDDLALIFLAMVFLFPIAVMAPAALQGGVASLLSLSIYFGYFTLTEGVWGRTLGKLATGTRVVREDGTAVTIGHAFLRSLARMIPFEPFSFLGGSGRGWHDRLPRTRVVRIT